MNTPTELSELGPEWTPCVKLPITVHVRKQRPGETHVSTREGITPVRPDDLIMRGVAGEEYPIGRELFERTYRVGDAAPALEPVALESVHLTRDASGMCIVRVNGRTAIRDNGDIIDHMATLEWFAAPAPAVPPVAMRPEVVAFANLMERELRNNDHKGGWKDDAPGRLLERAEEEMREFFAAFLSYPRDTYKYRDDLASEGADVANMLMMVLDVCGALGIKQGGQHG